MIKIKKAQQVLKYWMQKPIKPMNIKSKIVFLCASALNSTWVLFNSATDIWPDGLGKQQW